ncbi:hypothetical protein RFM99_31980 [Mesorhizobium sp. VK4C]|nr:hypothetical protein [Mesorhizobium sp. VK4C]MDX8502985.1 hypothetical protein [Mesorhizobium sp. VK4C]
MPGITQGDRILGAASEPHAGGGAFERQPLAPGARPGRLRPGEGIERGERGAGLEGGVDVACSSTQSAITIEVEVPIRTFLLTVKVAGTRKRSRMAAPTLQSLLFCAHFGVRCGDLQR